MKIRCSQVAVTLLLALTACTTVTPTAPLQTPLPSPKVSVATALPPPTLEPAFTPTPTYLPSEILKELQMKALATRKPGWVNLKTTIQCERDEINEHSWSRCPMVEDYWMRLDEAFVIVESVLVQRWLDGTPILHLVTSNGSTLDVASGEIKVAEPDEVAWEFRPPGFDEKVADTATRQSFPPENKEPGWYNTEATQVSITQTKGIPSIAFSTHTKHSSPVNFAGFALPVNEEIYTLLFDAQNGWLVASEFQLLLSDGTRRTAQSAQFELKYGTTPPDDVLSWLRRKAAMK